VPSRPWKQSGKGRQWVCRFVGVLRKAPGRVHFASNQPRLVSTPRHRGASPQELTMIVHDRKYQSVCVRLSRQRKLVLSMRWEPKMTCSARYIANLTLRSLRGQRRAYQPSIARASTRRMHIIHSVHLRRRISSLKGSWSDLGRPLSWEEGHATLTPICPSHSSTSTNPHLSEQNYSTSATRSR